MLGKIIFAAALLGTGAYVYSRYQRGQQKKVPVSPSGSTAVKPSTATPSFGAPHGSSILQDTQRKIIDTKNEVINDLHNIKAIIY